MSEWPRGAFKTIEEIQAHGEGRDSFVCYYVHESFNPIKKAILTFPWFRRYTAPEIPLNDDLGGYFPRLVTQNDLSVYAFPNYWDAFAYDCQLKSKLKSKQNA